MHDHTNQVKFLLSEKVGRDSQDRSRGTVLLRVKTIETVGRFP